VYTNLDGPRFGFEGAGALRNQHSAGLLLANEIAALVTFSLSS